MDAGTRGRGRRRRRRPDRGARPRSGRPPGDGARARSPAGRRRSGGGVRRPSAAGAPQVHQTHGFLARIVVELREHLPRRPRCAAGGRRSHHVEHRRAGRAAPGRRGPGRADRPAHDVRVGAAPGRPGRARASRSAPTSRSRASRPRAAPRDDGAPTVTGVVLAGGEVVGADAVVAAMGRRSPVPAWLAEHGVEIAESIHPSGLMYLTRWYRLPPGAFAELDPKLGGDLQFVKYLGVPGDGDTLSITLAVRPDDHELRAGAERPGRLRGGLPAAAGAGPVLPGRPARAGRRRAPDGRAAQPRAGPSPTPRASRSCSGSTPSATPTPARTRCTGGAARWRSCRPCG